MKFLVYYRTVCEFVHDKGKCYNYGGYSIVEGDHVEEVIHKWWYFATFELSELLGDNSKDEWRLERGQGGEFYGYCDDDKWKEGVRVEILAIPLTELSASLSALDTLNKNDSSLGIGERKRKPYGWWKGEKL